ncbi:dipeptidyl peptidase S46 family protein [Lacimicrobium alkaliphilum]|uniref:Dipeptidyl-peptidase n=2 Tax=Lacimicrobium alkaliphilum TaxID=1526571 RepID=A0ABQ1RQM4_9ALTE|nr:dipeptidyl peptidase S46 family protein [Lacimicrobium alkaliphilum]
MMKTTSLAALLLTSSTLMAAEGMWQPHQLPEIAPQLKAAGLQLDPDKMTDLSSFPMNAIISLGGCTASFVSPKGLAVTNHHCAYGSIQYNSSEDNNLLENGFVARDMSEEIAAAPGSRIYVTQSLTEVTDEIKNAVPDDAKGQNYYQAIEDKQKQLVADCEVSQDYRCEVYSFHGGKSYFLIKQMAIRDVRLVYAPPSSIGKFGGDTDNWMWPRHTGDWAFYRAYVGPDGQSADYSEDNVPYSSDSFLKVNASGVQENDYVMVLGYPGSTNRYRTAAEVENQFNWVYPTAKEYREAYIDMIKSVAPEGSDARIKYESTIAGLANYAKNYGSMIESFHKGDMLSRKQQLEQDFSKWLAANPDMQKQYGQALSQLKELVQKSQQNQQRDLLIGYMGRTSLWGVAKKLYRLAHERQKTDMKREPGYQQRDMTRFTQAMQRVNRRYDAQVDKAVLMHFIERYAQLEQAERVAVFDQFMGLENGFDKQAIAAKLDQMHANTKLDDEAQRLAWMEKSVAEFKASDDPYIQFAVSQFEHDMQQEKQDKELSGEFQRIRPQYMSALIAYKQSRQQQVYADANSSLRITYGKVKGYSPKDGMVAVPFTTAEGMLAKYVPGDDEFDLPESLRKAIKSEDYGKYRDEKLDSVQINYLSTLDITGGNSGSPTLNGKGEFVGLVFDGVYESIIGDWDYDPALNRGIHVSSPYMLWVMDKIDGADNLIQEMTVVE